MVISSAKMLKEVMRQSHEFYHSHIFLFLERNCQKIQHSCLGVHVPRMEMYRCDIQLEHPAIFETLGTPKQRMFGISWPAWPPTSFLKLTRIGKLRSRIIMPCGEKQTVIYIVGNSKLPGIFIDLYNSRTHCGFLIEVAHRSSLCSCFFLLTFDPDSW